MMIAGPAHETYARERLDVAGSPDSRRLRASPDNKRIAFVALDRLWMMDLPSGTPRRLVPSENVGEFQPTWSPDGQYIAYVTWNDLDGGTVSRIRSDGSGQPQKLTSKPAYYEKPAYSLDGRRIVVGRGPRNMRKDFEELERPPAQAVGVELVWVPGAGGAETLISPISNFGRPHFVDNDTTHVYFSEGSTLVSMRWDGTDQKTILRTGGGGGRGGGGGGGGGEMTLSPNGDRILLQVADQAGPRAYLINEIPKTGNAPTINAMNPAQSEVPGSQNRPALEESSLSGRSDGKQIYYGLGHSLFTYDRRGGGISGARLDQRARTLAPTRRTPAAMRARGVAVAVARPRVRSTKRRVATSRSRFRKDKPSGVVVLRGARILTMKAPR